MRCVEVIGVSGYRVVDALQKARRWVLLWCCVGGNFVSRFVYLKRRRSAFMARRRRQ